MQSDRPEKAAQTWNDLSERASWQAPARGGRLSGAGHPKHGQSIRCVDAKIVGSYCEQGTKSFGIQFGHFGALNNVICANFGLKTRSVYFRTGVTHVMAKFRPPHAAHQP